MSDLVTTKISKKSLQAVRLIAAYTEEKQFEIIERLLKAELQRVEKENQIDHRS